MSTLMIISFLSIFLATQKAMASTSWMDGDGSGSAHTTRFELPMDMKTLEGNVISSFYVSLKGYTVIT